MIKNSSTDLRGNILHSNHTQGKISLIKYLPVVRKSEGNRKGLKLKR